MDKTNNPQTPISSFTLPELLALAGNHDRQGIRSECIAVDSSTHIRGIQFPFRIEAFLIGVCTEGEIRMMFNLNEYRIKRNSLFLFNPNNILQMDPQEEFRVHLLAISTDLLRRLNINMKNMVPQLLQFAERPIIELSEEECGTFRNYIDLISKEIRHPEALYTQEIANQLLTALFYKTGDLLQHYLLTHPEAAAPVRDRSENYFRQFTQLLGEHYRRERSVGYYANQLCITPKYLSTIIKRISGRSVSEWIDNFVILEAKALLKYSDMSIQEIAYYLNFPNQSFFGSYFKRLTGMSPSQYKNSGNQNG